MGYEPDGHATGGLKAGQDADPDSPGKSSSFFARLFRRDMAEESADDAEGPAMSANAQEMLVNLHNMRRMRVDDISVPRTDIIAVPEGVSLPDLVETFQSSTYSRLPVYRETLDHPVGLVHLKDLALTYGFGANGKPLEIEALIRPMLYAPPSMPIGTLLQKMRATRSHMALVIDEYGGVDGLVTIEDIVEEIVGDIADEHDDEESDLWSEESPGVYQVQARMDLEDFAEELGVRLAGPEHDEEVDTLGGLVIRMSGRVPDRGETLVLPDGHEVEIIDADARRIKRLRVRLKPDHPDAGNAAAAE